MKVESKLVTPEVARDLLGKNTGNRRLRQAHIVSMAYALSSGGWDHRVACVMQVSRDGYLVDGQHRCHAVIRSGVPIRAIIVTADLDVGDGTTPTMAAIDLGAKRSIADVLGVSNRSTSIVTVMASVAGRPQSPESVRRVLDAHPEIEYLVEHAPTTRRGITTAPVSGAAVLRMVEHPGLSDEIADQFRALSIGDTGSMRPRIQTLQRQLLDGYAGAKKAWSLRPEQYARAWVAFDPTASSAAVRVTDASIKDVIAHMRGFMAAALEPKEGEEE